MRTLALRFLPRGRARARPSTISSLLHVLQLSSILFSILLFLPSPSVLRHHGAANEEKESDKDDDAWMMMSSSSPFSLSSVRSFVRSFVRKRENFWCLRPRREANKIERREGEEGELKVPKTYFRASETKHTFFDFLFAVCVRLEIEKNK